MAVWVWLWLHCVSGLIDKIHAAPFLTSCFWCISEFKLLAWLMLLFLEETPVVVLCFCVGCWVYWEIEWLYLLFKMKRKCPCRAHLAIPLPLKRSSLSFTEIFRLCLSSPSAPLCLITTPQTLLRFSTHQCFIPLRPPLSSLVLHSPHFLSPIFFRSPSLNLDILSNVWLWGYNSVPTKEYKSGFVT